MGNRVVPRSPAPWLRIGRAPSRRELERGRPINAPTAGHGPRDAGAGNAAHTKQRF